MLVQISGVTHLTRKNSIIVHDAIDERSTADLAVLDDGGALRFYKGEPVFVWDETGVRVFSGVIHSAQRVRVAPGFFEHRIVCADNHHFADKKIARKAYANMTAGAIVKDLVTTYLTVEGIFTDGGEGVYFPTPTHPAEHESVDTVDDGPIIFEAVFNYIPVSQAISALAEHAGFWWKIDQFKRLWFVDKSTNLVPFTLTNTDMRKGTISVTEINTKYRNVQFVKGGKFLTDSQVEIQKGDGVKRAFPVGFPLAQAPTIAVSIGGGAFTAQTVGIKGVDTAKQWYWAKGDLVVAQDSAETILTSADSVRVTYVGEYAGVALTRNEPEVLRVQALQGGSGRIEDVVDAPDLNSRDAAFQLANAKLEKYAQQARNIKFQTDVRGLEPGKLLPIVLPDYEATGDWLIESTRLTTDGPTVWYDILAVEGPSEGSWTKFFADMNERSKLPVVRENIGESEILLLLEQFSRTWLEPESPNPFYEVYPSATTFPDVPPMFAPEDRVKYLAWYVGGVEVGRKAFTSQTQSATEIFTTTFLNGAEANVDISHLGWWSGHSATSTPGTGIELDKQAFAKLKLLTEGLQIEKTDEKGW